MNIENFKRPLVVLASVSILGGRGGTTVSFAYDEVTDTTAGSNAVSAVTLDTASFTPGTEAGTLDHATAIATLGGSGIAVDAASVLSLDQTAVRYSYVAGLDALTSGDYAIIAIATDAADLPTNASVTYNGQATFVVTDSTSRYEGTMQSTVTANFGTTGNSVDVKLADVSDGLVSIGSAPAVDYGTGGNGVANEVIEFSTLAMSGATFTSGALTTAVVDEFGGALNSMATAGATITASGVFAGPTATEVAGAASVTTGVGNPIASITFTGTQ